eukprot:COSAG06_NODE_7173_length_2598_cov_1.920768_3_plen_64_part_00
MRLSTSMRLEEEERLQAGQREKRLLAVVGCTTVGCTTMAVAELSRARQVCKCKRPPSEFWATF